jgi:hypothetical protein
LLAARVARAGSVNVVATGDADLQATLSREAESWLRGHGHTVGTPLSPDAVSTLLNCMVMDDQGCAAGVVEARASGDAVLFAQAMKSRTSNATILIVYWFIKGKEPIGMRRACEECTPDLLTSTLDEMLGMVLGASTLARGRMSVSSDPPGLTVLLDNENIGVTPLEREVAAGPHTVALMHRGQRVGEKSVKIHADVTAEITIPVVLPAEQAGGSNGRSPLAGGLIMGLGGAALAAGVALYVTSEEDTGEKLYYRDTKALGIGVAAGGAVVAGLGVWLWLRARSGDGETSSAPAVSITPTGGTLGWAHAF